MYGSPYNSPYGLRRCKMGKIEDIIRTLNAVEVHGKQNLAMLLGCISALEEIANNEVEHGRQEN